MVSLSHLSEPIELNRFSDISLVPLADLPIQRVLEFGACPSDILTSYLQGICCAEGRSVDRNILSSGIVSREGHDGSTEHVADLRRAINWLDLSLTSGFAQLSTQPLPSGQTLFSEPQSCFQPAEGSKPALAQEALDILARWQKVAYDADATSFLDSELCLNVLDRPMVRGSESFAKRGF